RIDFGMVDGIDGREISVTAGEAGPAPGALGGWHVTVDPAPAAWDDSAGRDAVIPIPPSFRGGEVLLPSPPSPFVAVGQNEHDRDVRVFWDLRSGMHAGAMSGKLPIEGPMALSADGVLFAAQLKGGRDGAGRDGIGVWMARTGQSLGAIDRPSSTD